MRLCFVPVSVGISMCHVEARRNKTLFSSCAIESPKDGARGMGRAKCCIVAYNCFSLDICKH